jgi:hypothetical protein
MTEQKHFNYEGNIDLRTLHDPNTTFEITDVEFLTPARVKLVANGKETYVMVNIDIINRKVYDANGDTGLSDLVFNHIDKVNTLPEDFFAAPEELHKKAQEVEDERLRAEEVIGDYDHERSNVN